MTRRIGILHPGEMGSAVAASAVNSGVSVYWCEEQRSTTTRQRATRLGLKPLPTLQAMCATCEIIISVCPPHAAATQAEAVAACGYKGIYADINAIAPATAITMGTRMEAAGITFVDGGIIGLPPTERGTTWLYLSGTSAAVVAGCFNRGPLETEVLGNDIGQASALKMCFAANSKGSAALLTAILGAAEAMGVREALERQWDIYNPGFTDKTHDRIRQVARKAWRFTGEMEEIAVTLAAAGTPPDFFTGAAAVYERQAAFKDADQDPELATILAAITKK